MIDVTKIRGQLTHEYYAEESGARSTYLYRGSRIIVEEEQMHFYAVAYEPRSRGVNFAEVSFVSETGTLHLIR